MRAGIKSLFGFIQLIKVLVCNTCVIKFVPGKVCSSYGPLAYFDDDFISGKNVVISAER